MKNIWGKVEKIRDTNYEEKYIVELSNGKEDAKKSLFILSYFLTQEEGFKINNNKNQGLLGQIDSLKLQQSVSVGFKNNIILELQAIQDYELDNDCELKLQLVCKNCEKLYCECSENKFKLINLCEFIDQENKKEAILPKFMKKGQIVQYKIQFDLTQNRGISEGVQNLGKFIVSLKRFKNPDHKAIEL
jgi:hypothetical protein